VFNSFAGTPRRAAGSGIATAVDTDAGGERSSYANGDEGGGRWLEAVVRDSETGRTWYHNEVEMTCPQGVLAWPRIGAVVSDTDGATWDDLGVILSPRENTLTCDTKHPVTSGGIGDFSVVLDRGTDDSGRYLYFIFSSYGGTLAEQGISFARRPWIDRDQPLGRFSGESKASKWSGEDWSSPGIGGYSESIFHDRRQVSWTSSRNNGFWGPSGHWNWELQKYIVLMNRSLGGSYRSSGIYMTCTTSLDQPVSWAQPKRIVHPQVIDNADHKGTDAVGGAVSRYFIEGRSTSLILFLEP
jgi:hypothetical protein